MRVDLDKGKRGERVGVLCNRGHVYAALLQGPLEEIAMHVRTDLAHELGGHAKPRCLYGNIGRSTSSIALKEGLTIGGEPCLSEIDEHFAECYELRRENVGHEGPHLMLTGCVRDLQGHPKGK